MRQEKLSFILRKPCIRFYGDSRIMPSLVNFELEPKEREQFRRGSSFVYLNPENKLL